MKTNETKQIERMIFANFNDKYGRGQTVVLECQIGEHYKGIRLGIVDAIAYNQTKDEFVCFEIKTSVADFHSKAKKLLLAIEIITLCRLRFMKKSKTKYLKI